MAKVTISPRQPGPLLTRRPACRRSPPAKRHDLQPRTRGERGYGLVAFHMKSVRCQIDLGERSGRS